MGEEFYRIVEYSGQYRNKIIAEKMRRREALLLVNALFAENEINRCGFSYLIEKQLDEDICWDKENDEEEIEELEAKSAFNEHNIEDEESTERYISVASWRLIKDDGEHCTFKCSCCGKSVEVDSNKINTLYEDHNKCDKCGSRMEVDLDWYGVEG